MTGVLCTVYGAQVYLCILMVLLVPRTVFKAATVHIDIFHASKIARCMFVHKNVQIVSPKNRTRQNQKNKQTKRSKKEQKESGRMHRLKVTLE